MLVLSRTRISLAILLGIVAMLVLASVAPANAKAKGNTSKANKAPPVMTEDNDRNDGGSPNNVVDNGDHTHPSGKDRSVEHGKSGNQGSAKADPDDNRRGPDRSNGGVDQPNRPGGTDKADQDGNNGCGNDDDFEDDNEGRCGGKARPVKPAPGGLPRRLDGPGRPDRPDGHRQGPDRRRQGQRRRRGGVIIVRPPTNGDNDNDNDNDKPGVIVQRRPAPAPDRTFTRALPPADQPNVVLAATGSRVVALASIAALALLLGGGLLGIRRFAPKQ